MKKWKIMVNISISMIMLTRSSERFLIQTGILVWNIDGFHFKINNVVFRRKYLFYSISYWQFGFQKEIQDSGVYWMFSGICVLNLVFTATIVKETKGKTRAQIAEMFGKYESIQ